MCFSPEADLVAGLALVPVATATLRSVRAVRQLPLACLPAIFAAHQLVEAVVWAGTEGTVSSTWQHAAMVVYLAVALPLLPALVPIAVALVEPPERRRRTLPFVALGLVVGAYLTWVIATHDLQVHAQPHALDYSTGMTHGVPWTMAYIVAVVGVCLVSGYRSLVVFGVLNAVGLTVVLLIYTQAFLSLWCVYAAVVSVCVVLHLRRVSRCNRTSDSRPSAAHAVR